MIDKLQFVQHLANLGMALTSKEVLPQTLLIIGQTAVEVLGADLVDIYEYRADHEIFILPPIVLGERRFDDLKPEKIHPDDVVVKIVASGEPVYASDAQSDSILAADWQIPRQQRWPAQRFVFREGIVSSAGLPLKVGGETVGVLFLSYRHKQDFEADTELRAGCEIFGSHAAVAIHNARILADLQKQVKGHRTLNQIGHEFAGILEETSVLNKVARAVVDTLECTHCSVFKHEGNKIVIKSVQGVREQVFPLGKSFALGDGIAGWVAVHSEPVLLTDTRLDDRFNVEWSESPPLSLLVVPIIVYGQTYGVISVEHNRIGAFDKYDRQLLEILASQVGQAIANAQLYQQRLNDLVVLQEINRAIVYENWGEAGSLDKSLNFVASRLVNLFSAGSCAIRLYNLETQEFGKRVTVGSLSGLENPAPRLDGTTNYIIRTGNPLFINDLSAKIPGSDVVAIRREFQDEGVESIAYLPLLSGQRVIGTLYIEWDRYYDFSENDERLLGLFAGWTASAIRIAELLREQEQYTSKLSALYNTTRDIVQSTTTELAITLDRILETIHSILGFDFVQLDLVDEEANEVKAVSGINVTDQHILESRESLDSDDIMAYVVHTGETVRIAGWDERLDPTRYEKQHHADVVRVFTPLKASDANIGLIEVGYRLAKRTQITDDEVQLLETFASQAAIAIQSASLFAQLKRANALLEQQSAELRQANEQLEQQQVVERETLMQLDSDMSNIPLWEL